MYNVFILTMLVIESIRLGVNCYKAYIAGGAESVIVIIIGICLIVWMIALIMLPPV